MGNKGQPVVRKVKAKPVKDELDRQKQAEKKKRRLEKALATSAAIISELEKKKQKKKEEQQRLDEEGAAIAEAVALHVLLEEDVKESCKLVLDKDDVFNPGYCPGNFELFMGRGRPGFPFQDSRLHCHDYDRCQWHCLGTEPWSFSSRHFREECHASRSEDAGWGTTGISVGIIAAQAVSSLQIAEDADHERIVFHGRWCK